MKYTIVYWSRYGHNKKVVTYLAEKLKNKNAQTQVLTADDADPSALPEAEVYIFSAASEMFSLNKNMKSFMKKLKSMDGKKYAIINTHGMDSHKLHKMEKILLKKKMVKLAEVDFKIGKDSKSGDAFIGDWKPKIDEFVKKI